MCPVEGISVFVAADRKADLLLSCLNPLPQAVIDDFQMRNLDDLPLAARIRPCDALAGARILDVTAPVPFEAPRVQRVVQNAGAAIGLTADGGVTPWSAFETGDAFQIELPSNRAGTASLGKISENPADDPGLRGIDATLPGARADDIVAIGLTARKPAWRARPSWPRQVFSRKSAK